LNYLKTIYHFQNNAVNGATDADGGFVFPVQEDDFWVTACGILDFLRNAWYHCPMNRKDEITFNAYEPFVSSKSENKKGDMK